MIPFIAVATVIALKYYLLASLQIHGHAVNKFTFFSFGVDLHGCHQERPFDFQTTGTCADLSLYVFGQPSTRLISPSLHHVQAYFGSTLYPIFPSKQTLSVSLVAESLTELDTPSGTNGTIGFSTPVFDFASGFSPITDFPSDANLWLGENTSTIECLPEPDPETNVALIKAGPPDVVSIGLTETEETPVRRDVCVVGFFAASVSPIDVVDGIGIELVILECPINGTNNIGADIMTESFLYAFIGGDNLVDAVVESAVESVVTIGDALMEPELAGNVNISTPTMATNSSVGSNTGTRGAGANISAYMRISAFPSVHIVMGFLVFLYGVSRHCASIDDLLAFLVVMGPVYRAIRSRGYTVMCNVLKHVPMVARVTRVSLIVACFTKGSVGGLAWLLVVEALDILAAVLLKLLQNSLHELAQLPFSLMPVDLFDGVGSRLTALYASVAGIVAAVLPGTIRNFAKNKSPPASVENVPASDSNESAVVSMQLDGETALRAVRGVQQDITQAVATTDLPLGFSMDSISVDPDLIRCTELIKNERSIIPRDDPSHDGDIDFLEWVDAKDVPLVKTPIGNFPPLVVSRRSRRPNVKDYPSFLSGDGEIETSSSRSFEFADCSHSSIRRSPGAFPSFV